MQGDTNSPGNAPQQTERFPVKMNSLQLPKNGFYICLSRCNWTDVEIFDQEVEDVRGDKGWQCRAKLNILYAEVQQRQEDDNCLLSLRAAAAGRKRRDWRSATAECAGGWRG